MANFKQKYNIYDPTRLCWAVGDDGNPPNTSDFFYNPYNPDGYFALAQEYIEDVGI